VADLRAAGVTNRYLRALRFRGIEEYLAANGGQLSVKYTHAGPQAP